MNIIGKIFVFAVFVMSLVFMSFAVAVYSTHTNWREEIERTADQVQAGKPLGYAAQLAQAETDRKALRQQIEALARQVGEKEAARDQIVAKLQTALEQKDKELNALREEKEKVENDREKEQKKLAEDIEKLANLKETIDQLRDEIDAEKKKAKEHVDRTAQLAGELHEKESFLEIATERKKQLEQQVKNARDLLKQHGLAIESLPRDHVPAIDGVVTAVADDSVEVTLGGDDGVQMGHFLEVWRNDEYLGRVQVISVKPDRCVGRVVPEFRRGIIQPGDRVATRLKA